jgi:UDP-glucose 4-epimerase
MTKKILVTGGSGFLGSHIADALSDQGHEVTLLDIKRSSFKRSDQKEILCNVMDPEAIRNAVKGQDFVFHLAAVSDIDVAENQPFETIQVNVLGTINLLEACRNEKVERVIFASSIYVYSRTGGFYRISKHACELLLEEYRERFGLDYTILRFGTLYGTRSDDHNSVYRYLKEALQTGKIIFKGTGEEVREYIHVKDSARICCKILEPQFAGQNLILTGPHRVKVTELLQMMREILSFKVEIVHDPKNINSHYIQTPYSYLPRVGQKISSETYSDIGQSLIEILEEIDVKAVQP